MAADFHANLDRALDHVRFEIGDTGEVGTMMVANETITAIIAIPQITYNQAIVKILVSLINRYATAPDLVWQYNISQVQFKQRLDSWKATLSVAKSGGLIDPIGLASVQQSATVAVRNSAQF